jgi:uncharacterized protein (TIGR02284 family)
MNNDEIISTLNDLIETAKDGEEGFRTCAADVDSAQLKMLFNSRSTGCAAAAHELQQLVLSLGGDPETDSSFSGNLHRRWVDIKSAIFGKDNTAILTECERGEEVALRSYKNALAKQLPPAIHAVVERQYSGVQQNCMEIQTLRRQAAHQS